jgi:hypothetical protein
MPSLILILIFASISTFSTIADDTNPNINFNADDNTDIITVTSVSDSNILWSNIDIIGNCSYSNVGTYVDKNDQITNCTGNIIIKYNPTNTLLGIFEFSTPVVKMENCWIFGTVYLKANESLISQPNATVFYQEYYENPNTVNISWNVEYTDINGYYLIELTPGKYTLQAGKRQIRSDSTTVSLNANDRIKQDFFIDESDITQPEMPKKYLYLIQEHNYTKIEQAIKNKTVGGEITIWKDENEDYSHEILIYENLEIPGVNIEKEKISFLISGDENTTGKTIVVTVDKSIISKIDDIIIEYDKEPIKMADDINDILNPNDDGVKPEYLLSIGANSTQILISIPHFSEHQISVYSLSEIFESIAVITMIIFYILTCVIATVIFVGSIKLRKKY